MIAMAHGQTQTVQPMSACNMDRRIVSRGRLRPVLQTAWVLVALAFSVVAVAIPPPPPRSAEQLDLPPDGSERSISGEVRAYQPVPVELDRKSVV